MKKLLLVLMSLVLLIAITVAIVLASFDADRFRPQLVAGLQDALGKPVTLERLALGWREGIAVQLHGLTIHQAAGATGEPLLQVESANGILDVMPLLRKRVQIASIVLQRPRILVARDTQGHVNLTGLAAAAGPTAASGRTAHVEGSPIAFAVGSLRIEDGTLHWTDALSQPPVDAWLKALDVTVKNITPGKPLDLEARGALASERPNLHLTARLVPPTDRSPGACEQLTLHLDGVPLEQLVPSRGPSDPALHGELSMSVRGSAATLDPIQLAQALEASGTLKLDHPKIANLNVLREVFARFAMLPGLIQALEARLPPEYQSKLAAHDTLLSPVDVELRLERGALAFDDLQVQAEAFRLSGAGRIGIDGSVNIRALLRIEPLLSAALIRSVQELQALTNHNGEMEIPLTVQGPASRLTVLPDMNYVASKVLTAKATSLLGELFSKTQESSEGSAQPNAQQEEPLVENLLGQFLQRTLQQDSSTEQAPSP